MSVLADLEHPPEQLRALTGELLQRVAQQDKALLERDQTIQHHKAVNEKLSYELALLKRHRFGRRSETLHPDQVSLLDELVDTDIAALEAELEKQAIPAKTKPSAKKQPKRAPLPANLPRRVIAHEPENTQCGCGCGLRRIGEDISEKLDYTPGTFTVEPHSRQVGL